MHSSWMMHSSEKALQCVAVCCIEKCVAVHCSALQCVAVRCSALQYVALSIFG